MNWFLVIWTTINFGGIDPGFSPQLSPSSVTDTVIQVKVPSEDICKQIQEANKSKFRSECWSKNVEVNNTPTSVYMNPSITLDNNKIDPDTPLILQDMGRNR